jgi:hypothetical protein
MLDSMATRAADPKSEALDVMIESPRGATVKFKYDSGALRAVREPSKKARSRRRSRR